MSDPRNLIARDIPIPRYSVLEVEVVTTYLVPLGDDWYEDEPLTLDAVEKALGKWETDRARELARNHDQSDDPMLNEWRIYGLPDVRFENAWERSLRDGSGPAWARDSFDKEYVRPPVPKEATP